MPASWLVFDTPAEAPWANYYARALGAQAKATVGPASLVLRGETVPAGSYWIGHPVIPWTEPLAAPPRNDPKGG